MTPDSSGYEPAINEISAAEILDRIPPDAFDALLPMSSRDARENLARYLPGATEATLNDVIAEMLDNCC